MHYINCILLRGNMACTKCKDFGAVGKNCSECGKCYFCGGINVHLEKCVMTPPKIEIKKTENCGNCKVFLKDERDKDRQGCCRLNPEGFPKFSHEWCSQWRDK